MKNNDSAAQPPSLLRTRRLVLRAVGATLAIGLLAGCGAGATTGSGAGNADVATGGSKFTTADAETAKLGTDAAPGVFPRVIKHASGETTIEKKPTRVVVLDTGELDDVLSLGITPVGIPTTKGKNSIPSYLASKVEGVATVGTIADLNLEAIAALKPDLILGSKLRADKLYTQLSAIAPTVFSIRPGFPWKENFLLVGKTLGEEKQSIDILNDYQAQAEALDKDVTGDPKISLVRFLPDKIRLYGNKSLIGVILADAGLARPENQNIDELAAEISAENLDQADSDWVFYSSYGDPATTGEQAALEGPVWSKLGAVKAGQAKAINDDVWFLGLGPAGAQLILADLRELLVK